MLKLKKYIKAQNGMFFILFILFSGCSIEHQISINMDINKLDYDYTNHRLNAVEKVYQNIPEENNGDLTTMKDRLDDTKVAARINPSLLNPFKNNPYTKSLESFAY